MSPHIPVPLAREVRERARDCCEYCLLPQGSQEATFHIDHVVPRAAGGETVASNLALACVSCSLRKAARTEAVDPDTRQPVAIFNPRQQTWNQHFQINDEFLIEGLTPTGRAAIAALNMNRSRIVAIRQELNWLGRFPPS